MFSLTPHKSNPNQGFNCKSSIDDRGDYIVISYEVAPYLQSYTSDKFSLDYRDNKGLWDFDVCEAFLSFEGESYIELQSSPLNQSFAYIIEKPRESFFIPPDIDLSVKNEVIDDLWKCKIKIAKKDIPGSGKLKGNLFTCLGRAEERSYFALNINSEDEPDFHRPELFKELL